MPQPYNYTVAQPQAASYFDAFRQGRTDRMAAEGEARNKALAQYLPGALSGDEEARKQALASANPDQQISLAGHFAQMDAQQLADLREKQGKVASLAAWADTPEKWAVANAEAKRLIPNSPDIPFEQRGAVIAQAQTVAQQLDQAWKEKNFAETARHNRATEAAASARGGSGAKAPQGYMWSPDGSRLVAVPGGPADPTRKLTEGQSKDLGFFNRGAKANEEMTPERLGAQTGFFNTVGRSIGGNVAQSNLSRQGMQASRNFIAAILRKDTGAAVTPQEFDFYADIFLPQFGDDDKTVRLKADARVEALNAIREGLGSAQVLALPAVQAAQGGDQQEAPQSQPNTPPAAPGPQRTPIIKTQAEFDALPSGAIYVEPDGKRYRKP